LIHHLAAYQGITHHTALANLVPPGLELGFDQRDNAGRWIEDTQDRRQDQTQRDERHIHNREQRPFRQRFEGARVRALHDHHPGIAAQSVVQLAVANVDGVHPLGATLE
jgi:hypothetical protein